MTEETPRRLTVVPATRGRCLLSLAAGVILLALEVVDLTTHTVGNIYLTVFIAIMAVLMIVFAVIGLVSPRSRGH